MTAVCRIIHLHGGPSDGLRLTWNSGVSDDIYPLATPSADDSEYDYVYLPRAEKNKAQARRQRLAALDNRLKAKRWQRLWQACRAWLLAPCSYPLDCRKYRVDMAAKNSPNPQ
jgi:hypothetical protein